MNKFITKLANLFLGISMAAGVGVAVSARRNGISLAHAAAGDSPVILDATALSLTSTATTAEVTKTYGGVSYKVSNGAKSYSSSGSNRFSTNAAILIGKSGTYIYNNTALPGAITKFEIFTNTGASTKVSVGVKFGTSAITSWNATGAWTATLSSVNTVYDASSKITSGDTYFRYQVTNSNNSQVQIRITYASGPTKLATPTGLNYDSTDQQVKWNSVSNASGYKFSSDNGTSYSSTTTNLYYDVSSLTNGQTYTCKVYAVGDGSSYSDSDPASYSFTKTAPASYSSVTVSGGSQQGTEKGSAYIQCSASATGTNIPASPSFTWYVTETNTYGTTTSVTNKASIDNTGKVTFADSCTVYVWALAPDGSTHNTSGYAAEASGLTDPKGSETNPYSVSEARGVATTTANNTHVRGIIYEVSSYNSTYHSITYWISDDGTGVSSNKDGLQIYSGKGLNGADFSGTSDLTVGSTVVVQGDLKIYQSTTYELDKNSVIKSIQLPKTLSSIAVQTAPTKTAYKSGETFDPTGLVIRATYSDSTYEDVTYSAGISGSFTFSPSTITAAGNVTITYREKTCTQAVTLITVTKVDSVKSAPSEVYKDGSINPDDVTLNVTYSDNSKGEVKATSVLCDTSAIASGVTATALYSGATGTPNTATFTIDVVKEPVYIDVSDTITYSLIGVSGTSYVNWSGKTSTSSAVYAGTTAGGNTSIQINGTNRGLYSSDASGGKLYSVSVSWNTNTTNGRLISVYGTNTKPTAISTTDATLIGTITKNTSTEVVDSTLAYDYIIITGSSNAVYIDEIVITWKVLGTDNPMTAAPVLTLGSSTISVGRSTSLSVTTTPEDSDEALEVTSSAPSVATVTGSGKSYTVSGIATGSATIKVKGKQSKYEATTTITVEEAVQNEFDKVLTANALGLSGNQYTINDGDHNYDAEVFTTSNVCVSNGMQFRGNSGGNGRLYNKYALKGTVKSVTVIMNSENANTITVSKGSEANPSTTTVSPIKSFEAKGVNTYLIGENYFAIYTTGSSNAVVHIDKIIIELADNTTTLLSKARDAATAILAGLSGLCGSDGSFDVRQSDWDSINSDLDDIGLTSDVLLYLRTVERIALDDLSQGGAEIENAMAHYDACVTKYGFTPYTDITTAQANKYVSPLINIISNNTNTIAIIVVISMASVTAIGGYFFLKKRKENI